jgi:hypothetical protein
MNKIAKKEKVKSRKIKSIGETNKERRQNTRATC